jgi:hypothetical protein
MPSKSIKGVARISHAKTKVATLTNTGSERLATAMAKRASPFVRGPPCDTTTPPSAARRLICPFIMPHRPRVILAADKVLSPQAAGKRDGEFLKAP